MYYIYLYIYFCLHFCSPLFKLGIGLGFYSQIILCSDKNIYVRENNIRLYREWKKTLICIGYGTRWYTRQGAQKNVRCYSGGCGSYSRGWGWEAPFHPPGNRKKAAECQRRRSPLWPSSSVPSVEDQLFLSVLVNRMNMCTAENWYIGRQDYWFQRVFNMSQSEATASKDNTGYARKIESEEVSHDGIRTHFRKK